MNENVASKANYTVELKMRYSIDETLILGKRKSNNKHYLHEYFNVRFKKKQNLITK